jgi:hypothetical protein
LHSSSESHNVSEVGLDTLGNTFTWSGVDMVTCISPLQSDISYNMQFMCAIILSCCTSCSSVVAELIAMKVSRIEKGRGIVADVSDILHACEVSCKTVGNLSTLSLPKRRLLFCKGNLMISANIA